MDKNRSGKAVNRRTATPNPTKETPRGASVGGRTHPAKGKGANKGRGTRFGV